ncbi:T-complex protein 1 [Cystobasidium minutum MCA 4210]|uniref:T-complex protein 1 n=1 Tax=Cystobasidium minutum MCA 4210 TaxID=1397322 RepID=UPI0034CFC3B4|eukprot:jgi/Rhomi1/150780/estExt_Genewise1.C_2_t40131
MALKVPKSGPSIFKDGYSFQSGIEDAVIRNIQAVAQITEIVRTSFGPNGRNKMVINHLDRLFVTNDAATILRELEVVHPAAKVLVMASQQQEAEMGDRTNFVLMFAGELLKKAEALLTMGLHPSEIIAGYELARDKAEEELKNLKSRTIPTPLTVESLALPLRSVLAAKQYGHEDLLAKLVAEASLAVMPSKSSDFNVDNVRVVKIMGGSLEKSRVVRGMVLGREPEGTLKKATNAKVAVYTSGIDVAQTETKGTVLLKNADELLNFSTGEEKHLEKVIKEIADANVNVVIAGAAVGELAQHYLNRYGILVVKVMSKFDLRRLCRVVGATPLARLGAPTAEEAGHADIVETVEIGGDRVTVFRQEQDKTRTATIVLRGATANRLDDVERAVDDGVNVVKSIIRDPRILPGAGATEVELAKRIAEFGERTPGLSQHGIKRFAEALEVVPRTLAENAGLDATEVMSALYAQHHANDEGTAGVDVESESGGVVDAAKAGIFDLYESTLWAIRYGTEAAISVLRVDSIIMSKAAGIAPPKQQGHWDDD